LVRAEEAEKQLREQLDLTEKAELEKTEKLRQSYVEQARAGRFSGRAGQRFESLKALAEAAKIRPEPRLRDEAIACLALPDARLVRDWEGLPEGTVAFDLDGTGRCYARTSHSGDVSVLRLDDDTEIAQLKGLGKKVQPFFSPDGKVLALCSQGSGR